MSILYPFRLMLRDDELWGYIQRYFLYLVSNDAHQDEVLQEVPITIQSIAVPRRHHGFLLLLESAMRTPVRVASIGTPI